MPSDYRAAASRLLITGSFKLGKHHDSVPLYILESLKLSVVRSIIVLTAQNAVDVTRALGVTRI
jgi:hypothetical protein